MLSEELRRKEKSSMRVKRFQEFYLVRASINIFLYNIYSPYMSERESSSDRKVIQLILVMLPSRKLTS